MKMEHQEVGSGSVTSLRDKGAPPAPDPALDAGIAPKFKALESVHSPPPGDGEWTVEGITPEASLEMLAEALGLLATATGDIPPTPTPTHPTPPYTSNGRERRKSSTSRPATPVPDIHPNELSTASIPDPEAAPSEPAIAFVDDEAYQVGAQHEMIARKFFSKTVPPVSIRDYLLRLQRYCPMSAAVYLAAGAYVHKLAVEERTIPVTQRTMHRLALASLRVAMKALEDLRYSQCRFAGVGGVAGSELGKLEIALCYLIDFELQLESELLYSKVEALRQAARQAAFVSSDSRLVFEPRIPTSKKRNW